MLATKFGFDMTVEPLGSRFNSHPDNIRKVAENSLRYLQTDYIDVFYQHILDPNIPIEEVAGTVGELIKEGKVKYFGLSNVGPETIRRAHAVTPVSVLQSEYSIFEREVEEKTLPVLREFGIGLVPYAPLGRGFLTDAVKPAEEYAEDDFRRIDERWKGENFIYNLRATEQLKEMAVDKDILGLYDVHNPESDYLRKVHRDPNLQNDDYLSVSNCCKDHHLKTLSELQ